MDDPHAEPAGLEEALRTLGQATRYMGGLRLVQRQVIRLLEGRDPGPLTVLDVGCGGGDLALGLRVWLGARGWTPRFLLTDLHPGAIDIARRRLRGPDGGSNREFILFRADGARLPLGDATVDLALSSTTLHHLEDAAAREFVAELGRVSRIGWAVIDVRRSWLGYAGIRLLAATLWRRRAFPRVDGPLSVLRAFTTREAADLAREAGRMDVTAEGRPFRWAIREGTP